MTKQTVTAQEQEFRSFLERLNHSQIQEVAALLHLLFQDEAKARRQNRKILNGIKAESSSEMVGGFQALLDDIHAKVSMFNTVTQEGSPVEPESIRKMLGRFEKELFNARAFLLKYRCRLEATTH